MSDVRMLPMRWFSDASVVIGASKSLLLCGAIYLSSEEPKQKSNPIPDSASESEDFIQKTNRVQPSVLGKRDASSINVSATQTDLEAPETAKKITPVKTFLRRSNLDIKTNNNNNNSSTDPASLLQLLDQQQSLLEQTQEQQHGQMLDCAVQIWRRSRPDVVLLTQEQSRHRCENRLLTFGIVQHSNYQDVPKKNAPRPKHIANQQQMVLYSSNGRAVNDIPCHLTHLVLFLYRDGHFCVFDGDRRIRLCRDPNNAATHRVSREVWRDDTLYMCNSTGWVHRCGKYCNASVMVSSTQYCYTCPITGITDASRCLEVNSFWTPENETQGVTTDVGGGSSSGFGQDSGNSGDGSYATGKEQTGSMGDGGIDSMQSTGVAEDTRLRQMFMRDGNLRRHGETLMHQLNFTEINNDWLPQLMQRRNREEIENFSRDYIRATMRSNRAAAYLMLVMCDLWLLLSQERRNLEQKRLYLCHKTAVGLSEHTRMNHERLVMQRNAHDLYTSSIDDSSINRGQPNTSVTMRPFQLMCMTTQYFAHVAQMHAPILPEITSCATFIKTHACAVVQLWYVLHTRVLGDIMPLRSSNSSTKKIPNDTIKPLISPIPISKFVLPALYVLSEGVTYGALFEGQVDQVLISAQPALAFMLPCNEVLQALCGASNTTCRALAAQIKYTLIDAVHWGRCTVQSLDFASIPFERMDTARFCSLDMRERTTT